MIGITQTRLDRVKKISLKGYLSSNHPLLFRTRKNGCLVYKQDPSYVIYDDHAYVFAEVAHPFKDNIGTLRELFGYGFVEAVELLEEWQDLQDQLQTEYASSSADGITDKANSTEEGTMFIPPGISEVYEESD